jgi:hypothetical protein
MTARNTLFVIDINFKGIKIHLNDIIYIIAILWQLMRAYVLSILEKISGQGHPITEEGIIEWANQKVGIYLTMKHREKFSTNIRISI